MRSLKRISLRSPAKINLSLKVIRKRTDGFHDIVTLFERISLHDQVTLKLNQSGRIRIFCKDPDVPKGPKNLAYQAAKLLQDSFALQNGVDIYIRKRIPVAAGLAGGSSNAATVLLGLSRLWKLSLSRKELIAFADKIGSDVAFFLWGTSFAVGRGRGNLIKPVKIRQKLWHILIMPGLKVYSREVFGAFKLKLTKKNDNVNILIHALRKKDLLKAKSLMKNDLKEVVFKRYQGLQEVSQKLKMLNVPQAFLSGSGPAIFALIHSRGKAEALKSALKKSYKRVFVVSTL